MSKQDIKIEVQFIKEEEMFVAFSPALDLSSCGETFEEAQDNFEEAVNIFLEECSKDGTLSDVLESLGWKKINKPSPRWVPPPIVGRIEMPISVPAWSVGRISSIHYKKFVKVIEFAGCTLAREESSHLVYKRIDLKRPVIVPKYKSLPKFIIMNNLRVLGISHEQYLKILKSI